MDFAGLALEEMMGVLGASVVDGLLRMSLLVGI